MTTAGPPQGRIPKREARRYSCNPSTARCAGTRAHPFHAASRTRCGSLHHPLPLARGQPRRACHLRDQFRSRFAIGRGTPCPDGRASGSRHSGVEVIPEQAPVRSRTPLLTRHAVENGPAGVTWSRRSITRASAMRGIRVLLGSDRAGGDDRLAITTTFPIDSGPHHARPDRALSAIRKPSRAPGFVGGPNNSKAMIDTYAPADSTFSRPARHCCRKPWLLAAPDASARR